ncbi:endopeptidase [Candidatus Omnitrophus magneticus]|uniref:Endopeptidase n=1 Tax=Candidatus Omnitrophus magneticus TaxID=1609969 RepID=A0A0F0CMS1_9BACT|nr:endopeptidase [Candidatus Omnitrophus magneticus]
MYFISFPIRFGSSFLVEKKFGLSNQTLKAWIYDEIKSIILTFIICLSAGEIFYLILRNFKLWWLIISIIWIIFSIVFAKIFPVVIVPLFFKYLPLDNPELKSKIFALGKKSGIKLLDVSKINLSSKTKKTNAALVGLGGTRRIILADTLTDKFTTDEVLSVVAHEFAHHKYAHMSKLLIFISAATICSFFCVSLVIEKISVLIGAVNIYDLYLFPMLLLFITCFNLLIQPIFNAFSRILERSADEFALMVTDDPASFISMMEKLALSNLSEKSPSLLKKILFYDHPPIAERIMLAQKYSVH